MPIYEYQCPACGHRFEKLQKMSEPAITLCPSCGGEEVRKLVSQSAFILKGSGWYKDHYGLKKDGGGEKPGGKADAGAKAEGGGDKAAATPATAAAPAPAKAEPASKPAAPAASSSSAS